jgi:glutamate racemase
MGTVVERYTRQPVQGAIVRAGSNSTYTDRNGRFTVYATMGTVSFSVTHREFHAYAETLQVNRTVSQIGTILLDSKVRALGL